MYAYIGTSQRACCWQADVHGVLQAVVLQCVQAMHPTLLDVQGSMLWLCGAYAKALAGAH